MAKAYYSTVIDAAVDEVWAAARDFNGLGTWNAEMVPSCEIEDGKAGDQVGAVRNFTLANGAHLREKLLSHSDDERSYSYDFQKHPFEGVENYHATIQFLPIVDTGQTFVQWWTTFDTAPDQIDHWEGFYTNEVFKGALEALRAHVAS
jgi:polyketide cyclase/dehydrase/lipid transport protein